MLDERRSNAMCAKEWVYRNRVEFCTVRPGTGDGVTSDCSPELGNDEKSRIPSEVFQKQWAIPSLRWKAKVLNLKQPRQIGFAELAKSDSTGQESRNGAAYINFRIRGQEYQ